MKKLLTAQTGTREVRVKPKATGLDVGVNNSLTGFLGNQKTRIVFNLPFLINLQCFLPAATISANPATE